MKYKVFKLVFTIWIIIWAFLLMREAFIKGSLRDYSILLNRSLEGKRSYVTGDRLYEFLVFCNDKLPEGAAYRWAKTDKVDHARRRATYYLYPRLETEEAGFILIFDEPILTENTGFKIFSRLDDARYIMKKKGN